MIPIGLNDAKRNDLRQRVQQRLFTSASLKSRFLVAVSGGPDSMALLSMLVQDLETSSNRIAACYVDHGLRSTTDRDKSVIRGFTDENDIEFRVEKVDVTAHARQEHLSVEAAARELRYEALQKVAVECGCDLILTGHTLDDSAETVLMKMLSGAPWYEWTAIPAKRGNIVRPLLDILRFEVIDYLESANIFPAQDETNFDLRFRRNELRQKLRESSFWTSERIRELAQQGEQLEGYLRGIRSIAVPFTNCDSKQVFTGCASLAIKRILTYFTILPFLPVEAAWARLVNEPDSRLPSSLRRQISDCVTGSSDHSLIQLPQQLVMERRGDVVWVYRDIAVKIDQPVEVGETIVEPLKRKLVLANGINNESADEYSVLIDARFTSKKLILRNWRPGDRLKVRGRPTKKISDLLAQERLSPAERAKLLVLADEDGPLVLLGKYTDEHVLPTTDCRNYLKVSWIPLHDE